MDGEQRNVDCYNQTLRRGDIVGTLQIQRLFARVLGVEFEHGLKQRCKPFRNCFAKRRVVFVLSIDGVLVKPFQHTSDFRLHGKFPPRCWDIPGHSQPGQEFQRLEVHWVQGSRACIAQAPSEKCHCAKMAMNRGPAMRRIDPDRQRLASLP
jgi:hypothetical protein